MKKLLLILLVIYSTTTIAQQKIDAAAFEQSSKSLSKNRTIDSNWGVNPTIGYNAFGKLTDFYRNTQLQGHLVHQSLQLEEIPDFWISGCDFPYIKKKSAREVIFANHISITRFLGGFPQTWKHDGNQLPTNDLIYLDENGKVQYRLPLVYARLKPYIENGYTKFTIGIENIPWAISRDPSKSGPYGATEPPRDWDEWYRFIKAICMEMKRVYPLEVQKNLNFKIGNEYTQKKSFTGNQDDFYKLYDYSSKAILEVFPNAGILPGEIGGGPADLSNAVNYVELFRHLYNGKNAAGDEKPSPVVTLARSSHSFPEREDLSPMQRILLSDNSFHQVLDSLPNDFTKKLRLEFHQFGVLTGNSEPNYKFSAVHSASWHHQVLFRMHAAGRLNRCWNWQPCEKIKYAKENIMFLTGVGWLYTILDNQLNKDAYLLNYSSSVETNRQYTPTLFTTEKDVTLIVSSWSASKTENQKNEISIQIPQNILPFELKKKAMSVSLNNASSFSMLMKKELEENNNLKTAYFDSEYNTHTIQQMAADWPKALKMIIENFDSYKTWQQETLKLKSFADYKIIKQAKGKPNLLQISLDSDEVLVLVFKK